MNTDALLIEIDAALDGLAKRVAARRLSLLAQSAGDVFTVANLEQARQRLLAQAGQPLTLQPSVLLVPAAALTTAQAARLTAALGRYYARPPKKAKP